MDPSRMSPWFYLCSVPTADRKGTSLRSLEVKTLFFCSMFLNNAFCGKSLRTLGNIFRIGANLRFQRRMWHCCSPFSPGWKFKKARAKPLITGLPPSSWVLFLFALWAHIMLCSLLFKSAMLLRAALYLYVTVGPSCVTAPIRVHRFSMEW